MPINKDVEGRSIQLSDATATAMGVDLAMSYVRAINKDTTPSKKINITPALIRVFEPPREVQSGAFSAELQRPVKDVERRAK